MFTPQGVLITILLLFVLVGIHEWGHYYFAKRAGILVREFAIGFGPKLFNYKKGETSFTFRILPLGGFVRMAGEDPEQILINVGQTICVKQQDGLISHIYLDQLDQLNDIERGVVEHIDLEKALKITLDMDGELQTFSVDPQALMVARGKEIQIAPWNRQFGSKTVGQRSMSIFAGPMMNFVLAFVLFVILMYLVGIPLENPKYVKIDNVIENSVAEKANIQANDLVYKVNDKIIGADRQLLQDLISESADKQMTWIVIRNQEQVPIEFTPANVEGKGKIGVYIGEVTRNPNFIEAIKGAGNRMWESTKVIFTGLKKLVTLQFKMDDLGGPIRIVEVTGEAVSMGLPTLVFWAAILSLYLGIFNLLPFPALDGSRLLFLGLEAVRGKPVSASKESVVHFIGFAMLMLLMLAVTFNDIVRLFKG